MIPILAESRRRGPGLAPAAAARSAPGPAQLPGPARASEEPERLGGVADQEVLGLAVVLQHHLAVLPADAGDLVAAERGTRRVPVVTVRPYPARLDGTPHAERPAAVTGPHARA